MFDLTRPAPRWWGSFRLADYGWRFFFGFEFPLSVSVVEKGRAKANLSRTLPLEAGNSIAYSSVIGVAAQGQMRRDFFVILNWSGPPLPDISALQHLV